MWLSVLDFFHAIQCFQGSFMSCGCRHFVPFRSKAIFFFLRIVLNAQNLKARAETAESVMHKDPSLIPRARVRTWLMVVWTCHPRAGEVESGGSLELTGHQA